MAKGLRNASIKVSFEGDPSGVVRATKSAGAAINKLTRGLGVSRDEAAKFVDNLEKLDRVKAFQTLQGQLKKNQAALAAAKKEARDMGAEWRKTGDAIAKGVSDRARERVKKLSAEVRGQTAALRTEGDALRAVGVATNDLADTQKKLTGEIKKQERVWEARAKAAQRAQQMADLRARTAKIAADREKREAAARRQATAETERRAAAERRFVRQLTESIRRVRRLRAEQERATAARRAAARQTLLNSSALSGLAASAAAAVAALGGFTALRALGGVVTDFNTTIQSSRTGIAAIVRTFQKGEKSVESFNKSYVIAADIQRNLQIEGLKTAATYKQLLRALQEGIAPAMKQGFDPDQVVQFTSAMTKAAAAISLPMDQLGQEIRAILDGTIDRNARVAKVLGITNEIVKDMAGQGKLYDYLMGKLSEFGQAGDEVAKQWAGALSNFQDSVELALGQGFEDSFNEATKLVLRLTEAIVDIDEEAGTFTFNEKLSAAIKEIDSQIKEYLSGIEKSDIENAIEAIVGSAKELLNVVLAVTKAGMSLAGALGPAAPLLAKIAGYMAAIVVPAVAVGGALAAIIGEVIAFKVALGAFGIGAGAVGVVLGKIALGIGAFAAAYKAGEWLAMRDDMDALAESSARLELANKNLKDGLKEVSESTGLAILSWEDFEKAQKDGLIVYDQTTASWVAAEKRKQLAVFKTSEEAVSFMEAIDQAHKGGVVVHEEATDSWIVFEKEKQIAVLKTVEEMEAATKKIELSAKEQKEILTKLRKEYQDLVKEIESVEKQLTKLADKGAADQLKLANASRSPLEAWNAQKKAAQGLAPAIAAAKAEADRLAAAGDISGANKSYARAVELGEQMRAGFVALATEVKGNFTPAMQSSLDAAKEAAKSFGDGYKEAMDKAKKAGDSLKDTTQALADAEKGLADAQRDRRRELMTDAQAYQDIASEQRELEAASKASANASKAAFASGNEKLANQEIERSIALAREARQVAGELSRDKEAAARAEISARQLEIDALKIKQDFEKKIESEALASAAKLKASKEAEAAKVAELEEAKAEVVKTEAETAKEAARLEAEARQQITDILQAQKDLLTELADQKNAEADWTLGDAYTQAGEDAKALFEVNKNIQDQLKKIPADAVIDWGSAWSQIEAAGVKSAAEVEAKWDQATRDRYITTYVKEVQQRSGGGFAGPVQGLAKGGQPRRLSSRYITGGAGGVDRFGPVMLDHKEFVLRRASVQAPELAGDGLALAWAHNRQDWAGMHSLLSKHIGSAAQMSIDLPAVPAELSGVGRADRRGSGVEHTFVFQDPATKTVARVKGGQPDLDALERMFKHRGLVSSR